MNAEGFGLFTVTFQKKEGITPAERAAQYRKALEEIAALPPSGDGGMMRAQNIADEQVNGS